MQSGSDLYQILWTEKAQQEVQAVFAYLSEHWTDKQSQKLAMQLDTVLLNLKTEPRLYQRTDFETALPIHRAIILKLNSLIYVIDDNNRHIVILAFIDNRQNPFTLTDLLP